MQGTRGTVHGIPSREGGKKTEQKRRPQPSNEPIRVREIPPSAKTRVIRYWKLN
jgi:hypothetical protein